MAEGIDLDSGVMGLRFLNMAVFKAIFDNMSIGTPRSPGPVLL
jgi:hypothetical protein